MITLAIARAPREAGIDPDHATAVAEAVGETIAETAATRADLAAVELRLSDKITAASWRVIGVGLGGVGGLLALFRVLA